ncbi:glycoside hydrolase superfamily [Kalaharituber pfeilii]|nr:glycoside hydrolase superfamily [Kalaharituber pfeilii]
MPGSVSRPSNREPLIPTTIPTATSFHSLPLLPHPTENCFSDNYGRTLLLRGLNVGGCSKVPTIKTKIKVLNDLTEKVEVEETVSYSGRPFKSVEEAAEWWKKLRQWGVGIVRWVVTWEAIEPKAIGQYDDEYIDYLYRVLEKAGEYGLRVFIDIHQDCWSRLSGGSGAPAWTFSLVGLDYRKFHSTFTAAMLPPHPDEPGLPPVAPYIFSEPHLPPHQTALSKPSSHLWPTNYSKFAAATMFTMFFAGATFAPVHVVAVPGIGWKNIGELMQDAYINAFRYVARRLAGLECIVGWDAMNEPHPGYIGLPSLKRWNQNTELHLGVMTNGVQGMILASGGEGAPDPDLKIKLPVYHRSWPWPSAISEYVEYELRNAPRVWQDGKPDIWKEAGVWWWDEKSKVGYSCKEDYFTKHPETGAPIDFEKDFYEPFLRRCLAGVREGRAEGVKDLNLLESAGMGQWSFIEPVPNIGPPTLLEDAEEESDTNSRANVSCFEKRLSYSISFDVGALALGSRNFFEHSYFGRLGLLGNYRSQFTRLVSHVKTLRKSGKPTPVLVGETGVPFDINGFEAYKTGDVHWQLVMLDSIVGGMERVGKGNLNWTLWNFTSENYVAVDASGTIEAGDGWNSEDFSLVTRDNAMAEVPYTSKSSAPEGCRTASLTPNNSGVPLTRAQLFGDFYSGARCIGAWIRPYPAKIAGMLLKSQFTLANVDNGTKMCWGGTFEMKYSASVASDKQPEIARTTEIYIPAYHYGGESWTLKLSISKPGRGGAYDGAMILTSVISTSETSGTASLDRICPDSKVTWTYSEEKQTLEVVHSPRLAGYTIEVTAQVGLPPQKEWSVWEHILVWSLLALLGILIAIFAGSWFISKTMELRRVEFYRRGG